MPAFCAVVKCGSRGDRDKVSFYRFPAILNYKHKTELNELSVKRRNSWLQALKREDLTDQKLKYATVCSKHFISGSPAALIDANSPDWTPSQNLGYNEEGSLKRKRDIDRYERYYARSKKLRTEATTTSTATCVTAEDPASFEIEVPNSNSKATQTDFTMDDLAKLVSDLQFVNSKKCQLQEELWKCDILSEESLMRDDGKTKFYTGLSKFAVVEIIHDLVKPYLSDHSNSSLSTYQQLLLTLIKLRLNLSFKDLAYRFKVSPSTASSYFKRCIKVLYERLKNFIIWPDRDTLQLTMPQCFKESFGNKISIIIDCFEIFIERPTAAQCWSNYKHHTTIKFLIGITPQGSIAFISEAWGGRASDKFIVENSSFLNNILLGDVILADRGFLIQDSVKMLGASLNIPVFTKGKSQLHPIDIEETRSIANVRIHVERVISSVKQKYSILDGPLSISLVSDIRNGVSVVDHIAVVCCALVNLCGSMVPQ